MNGGKSFALRQTMRGGPFPSIKAPVSSGIIAFHTANLLLLFPVNEIKAAHSSHNQQRSRPKCQWLLDFSIQFEQTPRREGIWHEVIDRVPLQGLIRPLSAIIQVQYGCGI